MRCLSAFVVDLVEWAKVIANSMDSYAANEMAMKKAVETMKLLRHSEVR